jgi:hypothetical protein
LTISNKAHQIVAIAGSLDPSRASSNASNRQVSEGAEVRLAPGYAEGTQLDLALIRLKRPFKWRNGIVEPVCLPSLNVNTRQQANQTGKRQQTFLTTCKPTGLKKSF